MQKPTSTELLMYFGRSRAVAASPRRQAGEAGAPGGQGPWAGGTACPDSPGRLHAVLPQQRGAGALGPPVLEGYPPSGTGGRVAEGVRTPPELRGVRAFLGKRLPGRGHGGRWRSSWWRIARRSVLKGSAGGVRPEALCPTRALT